MNRTLVGAMTALLVGVATQARANLIANGGFEDGVYASTIDGATNASVPVGWDANAGYDTLGNFNMVSANGGHSGTHALSIANDPGYPIAGLGQSFTTQAGATYEAQFYIGDRMEPTGYFMASIDGSSQVRVVEDMDRSSFTSTFSDGRVIVTVPASPAAYTLESFDFTGTGKDTLTFEAVNDGLSYLVDDVSVTLAAKSDKPPTAVPEPAGWLPMLVGCLVTGIVVARPRRRFEAVHDHCRHPRNERAGF